MPRQARGEYVNPNEVQILHLVNRCVRRAYLCGDDPVSGQSFEMSNRMSNRDTQC